MGIPTIAIKPEVRGVRQLDHGIDHSFIGFLRLSVFRASRMEKSRISRGVEALQSIRKYGRYHRLIARPILFRLNGGGYMSPRDVCPPS